jgi:hypothetical protein
MVTDSWHTSSFGEYIISSRFTFWNKTASNEHILITIIKYSYTLAMPEASVWLITLIYLITISLLQQ